MNQIVKQIYDFFSVKNQVGGKNKKLIDFLNTQENFNLKNSDGIGTINYSLALSVNNICDQMIEQGLLLKVKVDIVVPFNNEYISLSTINTSNPEEAQRDIDYGSYDFKILGFTEIRRHFIKSVVPIVGENKEGDEDIGTAYYIGERKFVTAAHCITGLTKFNLLDDKENIIPVDEVWLPKENPNGVDLAIITLKEDINIPSFMIAEPSVLDSVLVMGYPPIPGVNPTLISENASVAAYRSKASDGQVVAESSSYLTKVESFIITARVKGGNSGGPVINDNGKVIGTVVEIPFDNQGGSDSGRYDIMGYGICLPSKYIQQLLDNHIVRKTQFDSHYFSLM